MSVTENINHPWKHGPKIVDIILGPSCQKLMRKNYVFVSLVIVSLMLIFNSLTGCTGKINNTNQEISPIPFATSTAFAPSQNTETAYPLITPKDSISHTAFDGLQIALEFSKTWNKQAFLYSIPNTAAMERNLGYPMTGLGWFYLFRNPDNPLELFIYVDDGIIQGSTEAEVAALIEVSEKSYNPLDTTRLLDSDEIMEIFYKSHDDMEKLNYQLELQFDESLKIPIWSIYKFFDGILDSVPIIRIDAVKGQVLNLPVKNP